MEKVDYHGWPNCYRLANEVVELIITTDVGPRIIYFGLINGRNEFANVPEQLGKTGGDEWQIYGGHRFWHAPEDIARTYFPDNHPITIEAHDGFVRLIQPTESTTRLQKEVDISLHEQKAQVTLTHRLWNHNAEPVECAPWALSVMGLEGTAVVPLPPRGPHKENFLPNTQLSLWPYTDMQDPRWYWGEKYIMLRQEPGNEKPQKVGAMVPDGWVAHACNGRLFVKTFSAQPDLPHPDMNVNVEVFTCEFMLEVETLGPTVNLAPETCVEHGEQWHLFANVPTPMNDKDVDTHILPIVQSIL